jgi:hypothetical protein
LNILHRILNAAISLVWLVNGLYCKVLDGVPRHRMIVSRILGPGYSGAASIAIGILEIGMCVWILSRITSRLCTLTQIVVIALMNLIEFFYARDLLLFGKWNIVIAAIFIGVIYMNEFYFSRPESNICRKKCSA